jgi:hypothetical protein
LRPRFAATVRNPGERFTRLQLAARVIAFIALGVVGVSFGMVFLFAYLALPVFAASRLSSGSSSYLADDGPRVLRALRWFAAVCAWAGLIVEHLPGREPGEHLAVAVDEGAAAEPTASGALWRVVTGIPSALVLAVLGCIGVFVWIWAALSVLLFERVGPGAHAFLAGLQRWCVRLLAYQASLVDEYPPFSFADDPSGPLSSTTGRAAGEPSR